MVRGLGGLAAEVVEAVAAAAEAPPAAVEALSSSAAAAVAATVGARPMLTVPVCPAIIDGDCATVELTEADMEHPKAMHLRHSGVFSMTQLRGKTPLKQMQASARIPRRISLIIVSVRGYWY